MNNKLTTQGQGARQALPPVSRRGWLAGMLALALLAGSGLGLAQSGSPVRFSEYDVKAAFLLNFLQFVEWPAAGTTNASTPMVIGVLGDYPFGTALDETIKGETVQGRPLTIRRARQVTELKECQLVFVCRSEKPRIREILAALRGGCALTVSDVEQFCQHGGIIGLVNEGGRIRFEINQAAAEQSNIKISSKLLRLARLTGT